MTNAYANMKVNVVGLGATGLSLVRFLHASGAEVVVFDSNANAAGRERLVEEFPSVQFKQIDLWRESLPRADLIALSPGVPRAANAIAGALKSGIEVVGDIELFARLKGGLDRIYAITGSNGKTTTAHLSGAIATQVDGLAKVVGNVGLPALDAAREYPNTRTWVMELSSFQLESTHSLVCESATVLNVTDNHLDRYPSFFDYAATKARIFTNAKQQVINRDDAWSASMRCFNGQCVSFGTTKPTNNHDVGVDHGYLVHGNTAVIAIDALQIRGSHNAANAMAAIALTTSLNVPLEKTQRALREFSGVPNRYEWLGNTDGIEIINDSKATTVVAASAALRASNAPTWLIAGGDGKAQSFGALANTAARCRAVHLIGRDADAIERELVTSGVMCRRFDTLEDATEVALDQAQPGDRVLLSPACASWDMFRNFEHRAEVFLRAVRAWASARGKVLSKEIAHA
jgi:UDP-N-acetylmuramoylalanine--D-glutamate ligase